MSDEQKLNALIQLYFDGMFEASSQKTIDAFHPDARIVGHMKGKLQQMSVTQFAEFVGQQASAKNQGVAPRLEVVSLDIAGDTAVARVRDDYLGQTYLDTLSCVRNDDQWQIFNKLYHVEGPAA